MQHILLIFNAFEGTNTLEDALMLLAIPSSHNLFKLARKAHGCYINGKDADPEVEEFLIQLSCLRYQLIEGNGQGDIPNDIWSLKDCMISDRNFEGVAISSMSQCGFLP